MLGENCRPTTSKLYWSDFDTVLDGIIVLLGSISRTKVATFDLELGSLHCVHAKCRPTQLR